MSSLFSFNFAALAADLVVGLFGGLFLLAVAVFVVAVGNGRDPDPRGARAMAAYYFAAAFLFLWAVFGGLAAAADSLIQLVGSQGLATNAAENAAIRDCVLAAILLVFAGAAFFLHLQRGTALADTEEDLTGPTRRVLRTYVAFVSLLAILVFVVAFVVAVWQAFRLWSPTIFLATGSRTQTTRGLLEALVLVVLSGSVFSFHQRFAPPSLRLLGTVGPHVPHRSLSTTATP